MIVPATPAGLHPEVMPAIARAGYDAELRVLPLDDVEGYYRLFCELWRDGETFCIVEHDIEVGEGTLAGLEACGEQWCASSYWVYWGDCMETYGVPGLGCTRFADKLIAALPELPDAVADFSVDSWPSRHWAILDGAVTQFLRGPCRLEAHRHLPNVTHHHAYDYAGAWVPPEAAAKMPIGHPLYAALPE